MKRNIDVDLELLNIDEIIKHVKQRLEKEHHISSLNINLNKIINLLSKLKLSKKILKLVKYSPILLSIGTGFYYFCATQTERGNVFLNSSQLESWMCLLLDLAIPGIIVCLGGGIYYSLSQYIDEIIAKEENIAKKLEQKIDIREKTFFQKEHSLYSMKTRLQDFEFIVSNLLTVQQRQNQRFFHCNIDTLYNLLEKYPLSTIILSLANGIDLETLLSSNTDSKDLNYTSNFILNTILNQKETLVTSENYIFRNNIQNILPSTISRHLPYYISSKNESEYNEQQYNLSFEDVINKTLKLIEESDKKAKNNILIASSCKKAYLSLINQKNKNKLLPKIRECDLQISSAQKIIEENEIRRKNLSFWQSMYDDLVSNHDKKWLFSSNIIDVIYNLLTKNNISCILLCLYNHKIDELISLTQSDDLSSLHSQVNLTVDRILSQKSQIILNNQQRYNDLSSSQVK